MKLNSVQMYMHTNAFAGVSRWVGVALVTVAAERALRVLAEAVVAADGVVDALVDVCKVRTGWW